MQQGKKLFQQQQFEKAIKPFSLAVQADPGKAEGWINLGISQVEVNAFEDALISLQEAINISSTIMLIYIGLGDAHRGLGNGEESLEAYQQAVMLQRTPISLNRLACLLRVKGEPDQAVMLYKEALKMAPHWTLLRVNIAITQLELQQYEECRKQLNVLNNLQLTPEERLAVDESLIPLNQYFQLEPILKNSFPSGNLKPLYKFLEKMPKKALAIDNLTLSKIKNHVNSANNLSFPVETDPVQLSEDWPFIEAFFVLPHVRTVDEYNRFKMELSSENKLTDEIERVINMKAAIQAVSNSLKHFHDPIQAEIYIRQGHALAMANIAENFPGQFKIRENTMLRIMNDDFTKPHLVSGTLRYFFSKIYGGCSPGMSRGLVTMMVLFDIHPFVDGNGRIGRILLNRELIAAGQTPILIPRGHTLHHQFCDAISEGRKQGGDLSYLLPIILEAQQLTRDFCLELRCS